MRRMMMNGFDAGSIGRRTANWNASSAGINSLLQFSLSTIRNRTRDQYRNNPWVKRASRSYVSNLIGTGIKPIATTDDKEFNAAISEVWNDWIEESDADGLFDFYGQQSLAVRSFRNSGEVLIRKLYRPTDEYDLVVPFQIQVIEADHLDHLYTQRLEDGGKIVQGVEFDAQGRRVAYHLFKEHPQEMLAGFGAAERVRVPASEILHVFEAERPGQVRGYPGMVSTVIRMLDMLEYEDAELVRKKLAAMMVGFITNGVDEDGNPLGATETSSGEPLSATLESGTLQELDPGQGIQFNEPADVGGAYNDFMKWNLRAGAAGSEVTYEGMTGDYAGVTFSSMRSALNEIQRIWRQVQNNVIIHQICRPIRKQFVLEAVKCRAVKMPKDFMARRRAYQRCEWQPDGWAYVNPLDDARADALEMRNGTTSRSRIVAGRGADIRDLDREIAADNERADDLGLVFDSDPRNTSAAGQPVDSKKDKDDQGKDKGDE